MAKRLTTTSYSLLGLLHLMPFSAYELTKYMQRSALANLWPRTEAATYHETKRLADAGLADATTETRGDRSRTVYRITPAGRRAFRAWLRAPGAGFSFECEPAVKAFFGSAADVTTLRSQLTALRDELEADASTASPAIERWAAGDLPFPERVHYTAMAADLIGRLRVAVHDWTTDWLDRTAGWDGTQLDEAKLAQAEAVLGDLRRTAARVAGAER